MMVETTATQRVGKVFYWLGSGIAAICGVGGALVVLLGMPTQPLDAKVFVIAMFGGTALLSWLAGRAFLYILAGE